ncbi:spore germination protein GerPE [Xylanibacillus composti]|nr:spore germination protein GerPE [Xylanibacillus composti]
MRISRVGHVKVTSKELSSITLIGDSVAITPRTNVLAVQRERPHYLGQEGDLQQFPFYEQPMPKLAARSAGPELFARNNSPFIDVGSLRILGLSASAVLHIGSTSFIDAESRVKHIRQLLSVEESEQEEA